MYKSLLLLCLAVLLLQNCKHETTLQPLVPVVCDTLHVSYNLCIKPIFINNCYACHSDSASQNGNIAFDIENFSSLKLYLNNYYHNDSIYGSKFLHIIEQTTGVIYMPPIGKLSQDNIDLVNKWLVAGAPEN